MRSIYFCLTAVIAVCLFIFSACAPRIASSSEYGNPDYDLRGLVTTGNDDIKSCLSFILSDNNDVRTDFRRIQDWVAKNVFYDNEVSDHWQKPAETLRTRRGDCKDYSTLLITLLRAQGVPSDSIYVAIGIGPGGKQHAFLIEKYVTGKWQVIEPQIGGFITSGLGAIDTAEKYAIMYLFNDREYSGKPSWIYSKIYGVDVSAVVAQPVEKKEPLPQINYFTMAPKRITGGQPSTLQWDVTGADYIAIDQGVGEVDPVGMAVIYPLENTEYRIVATNSAGIVNASASVNVMTAGGNMRIAESPSVNMFMGTPLTVGFSGWYNGDEPVSIAKVGQQITARIKISGGKAGQYIMRILRCVSVGHDDIVAQWAFKYDGVSAGQQISFAPSYAVGESGTVGYKLDVVYDSGQIWDMPDGYPPRLTVAPRPINGPLNVSFAGWRSGTETVQNIKKDNGVIGLIALTGGEEGQYTLKARRDTEGISDPVIQQLDFNYDGSSALQGILFIPEIPTGESMTRGYFLELYQGDKFIWSQSGAYPPRLKVMK